MHNTICRHMLSRCLYLQDGVQVTLCRGVSNALFNPLGHFQVVGISLTIQPIAGQVKRIRRMSMSQYPYRSIGSYSYYVHFKTITVAYW